MKPISRFRLYKLGFLYFIPRKIIAIADQKCGVRKTTSTVNIGAGITQLRKRLPFLIINPIDSHGAEDYLALYREIVGRGRYEMKKILLMIIYLFDLVNELIRYLAKKYKVRAAARR
jgi:hypothetical protein